MENFTEDRIRQVIAGVMTDMNIKKAETATVETETAVCPSLPDLRSICLKEKLFLRKAEKPERYLQMKQATTARLGIGRTGCRYLTQPYLRFLADHAVARDAVLCEVSEVFLKEWGIPSFNSRCRDKDEFLTRPDLGRLINKGEEEGLQQACGTGADVAVYICDGLSSIAVEQNSRDAYESLAASLTSAGLSVCKPFFLKFGRVGAMDHVSEILKTKVTIVLIGERPGLATSESLSFYMAYNAYRNMPEARRTVISNVHKDGTPAVEAGAQAADLVQLMIKRKASGVELAG